ncbi:MAG: orotidine-5'-phosphate decarboxylase [Candidatus Altiarchaeota archaeon]|nr:orotidine-5'-phosphate decarboxylase [Candidatus Altiarchaeota archaeon]
MQTTFLEKYQKARKEKDSILCIGLDPGLREFRRGDVVPLKYERGDVEKGLLEFCLETIEETADYACAIKPNSQYLLFTLSIKELKKITRKARENGLISILDHKLSDIGSTNDAAFYWIKEAGFDALTYSPFAGNIQEATNASHKRELGLLVLTYMSNIEAGWIQKQSLYEWKPLYQKIAEEIRTYESDGAIMGATGHITMDDIRMVRQQIGAEPLILFPGVGRQGGSLKPPIQAGGDNILINIGRDVIYDKNPGQKAKEYQKQIKQEIKDYKNQLEKQRRTAK